MEELKEIMHFISGFHRELGIADDEVSFLNGIKEKDRLLAYLGCTRTKTGSHRDLKRQGRRWSIPSASSGRSRTAIRNWRKKPGKRSAAPMKRPSGTFSGIYEGSSGGKKFRLKMIIQRTVCNRRMC